MAEIRAQHFVIVGTDAAQQLPRAAGAGFIRYGTFQPGVDNNNPVFIGGADVTPTSWGMRLPAAESGEPPAPCDMGFFRDGSVPLDAAYAYISSGEKLHIYVLTYI